MAGYPWRANVRYDPTMGENGTFLMRCESCVTKSKGTYFWPLTLEFWRPSVGLQRCIACLRYERRARHRQTPEEQRAYQRRRYHANREAVLRHRRAYYEKNHERINAQKRESYARRKASNGPATP